MFCLKFCIEKDDILLHSSGSFLVAKSGKDAHYVVSLTSGEICLFVVITHFQMHSFHLNWCKKIHFLSKFRFKKDRNFCYIELHKKLGQHCSFDNDLMVFLQLKKMEAMRNYCMVEEGDRKLSDEWLSRMLVNELKMNTEHILRNEFIKIASSQNWRIHRNIIMILIL